MNMKKLLLVLLLFPFLTNAQIQVSTGFSYVAERSSGEEANYTGSGFDISLRQYLSERLKLVANTGINSMRVSLAVQSRFDYSTVVYGYYFKNVIPLTFGVEYYLWNKRFIKPFVGLETGMYFTNYDSEIDPNYRHYARNIPVGSSVNWGVSPSIGIHFQENADRMGLFLKLKHTGISYGKDGLSNMLNLSAGFTFKFGRKIGWKPPVIEIPNEAPYYEKKE
jgi:hypothetical protein